MKSGSTRKSYRNICNRWTPNEHNHEPTFFPPYRVMIPTHKVYFQQLTQSITIYIFIGPSDQALSSVFASIDLQMTEVKSQIWHWSYMDPDSLGYIFFWPYTMLLVFKTLTYLSGSSKCYSSRYQEMRFHLRKDWIICGTNTNGQIHIDGDECTFLESVQYIAWPQIMPQDLKRRSNSNSVYSFWDWQMKPCVTHLKHASGLYYKTKILLFLSD